MIPYTLLYIGLLGILTINKLKGNIKSWLRKRTQPLHNACVCRHMYVCMYANMFVLVCWYIVGCRHGWPFCLATAAGTVGYLTLVLSFLHVPCTLRVATSRVSYSRGGIN